MNKLQTLITETLVSSLQFLFIKWRSYFPETSLKTKEKMWNLTCVVHTRKLCFINRDTFWFPSEQLATLVNWFADPKIRYRSALSSPHLDFKLETKLHMGYVLTSVLFDSQWHTVYVPPASYSWYHKLYGTALLCLTGRNLMVDTFRPMNNLAQPNQECDLSSVRYQESHTVYTLLATSKLLSSIKADQHLLIPADFLYSVISDKQLRCSKCFKHDVTVASDCLLHLKGINSLPVL